MTLLSWHFHPDTFLHLTDSLTMKQKWNLTLLPQLPSSPLSVSFQHSLLAHTKKQYANAHTHMHISPCPDTGTPLYPSFRLRGTRLIHLQSSRGERGATGGSNMERKRLRKSHLVLTVNLTEDLNTETKANRVWWKPVQLEPFVYCMFGIWHI